MTTFPLRRTFATVCFAVVALPMTAACSDDQPAASKTELTLTVTSADPAKSATRVTLHCQPTGGDHANAESACAALTGAGGDFDKIPGDPSAMCVQVYEPVTAAATGTWQGNTVNWERTFGNSCELRAKTTPVY